MAKQSEFVSYLLELLPPVLGPVTARGMFGGHGVFQDGCMFGLVADDQLYLKVDDDTKAEFDEAELEPFVYVKNGKPMEMSYRLAPEAIYDDEDALRHWGELAVSAARRAKQSKS